MKRLTEAAKSAHTDMAKGFIRAETCRWDELAEAGSFSKLRSSGKLRLEGKEYVVQDGTRCCFGIVRIFSFGIVRIFKGLVRGMEAELKRLIQEKSGER